MGGSTGVNVAGAIRMAKQLGPGHTIVTILCDYGTRYASKLFNPAFLREKTCPCPPGSKRCRRCRTSAKRFPREDIQSMSNDIVSTDWLEAHLGSPDIAILDASWHLPTARRDAEAGIPGRPTSRAPSSSTSMSLSDTVLAPAPHAAQPGEILLPHAQAGRGRRQAHHRL